MEERMVKTHLIITDIHEEYSIEWCGRIIDTKPLLRDGLPVFVLVSSVSRVELNTANMQRLEDCAKHITNPRGRSAITTDRTRIYIREVNNKETLIGVVTHNRVKSYAPMFDKIEYK